MRRLGLLIFASVLLIYLSFPTKTYYWDGIIFAQDIETGSGGHAFLHPNHLLYNPLGRELWLAAQAAGMNLRALTVLQVLSMLTGAAATAILFCILLEIGTSSYVAACLALAFALSATWWKFSTDADSYVPSTFLLIVCVWLFVRRDRPNVIAVGLVLSAAMLLHQLAALFFPSAVLALWSRSKGETPVRRFGKIAAFTLAAGIPAVSLYVLAFSSEHEFLTLGELLRWVVSHSPDSSFSFAFPHNLWISTLGHFRLVLGGKLRLVAEQMSPVSMIAGVALAVSVLLLIRRLIQVPPRLHAMPEKARKLLPVLALWCGTYALFLVVWLPRNTFYRLFYFPGLVMLCAPLLTGTKTKYNRLALAVSALFLLNFGFYIYPQSKPEANPNLQAAYAMHSVWAPGDVVYGDAFNTINLTIRYFNPQVEWKELWGRLYTSQIERSFDEAGGVWIDSVALAEFRRHDPELESWLLANCRIEETHEFPVSGHVIGFAKLLRRQRVER